MGLLSYYWRWRTFCNITKRTAGRYIIQSLILNLIKRQLTTHWPLSNNICLYCLFMIALTHMSFNHKIRELTCDSYPYVYMYIYIYMYILSAVSSFDWYELFYYLSNQFCSAGLVTINSCYLTQSRRCPHSDEMMARACRYDRPLIQPPRNNMVTVYNINGHMVLFCFILLLLCS